jgi:hypothetical protein
MDDFYSDPALLAAAQASTSKAASADRTALTKLYNKYRCRAWPCMRIKLNLLRFLTVLPLSETSSTT